MLERYMNDIISSYFGQYIIPPPSSSSSSSSSQQTNDTNTSTTNRSNKHQHQKIRISSWYGGTISLHNVYLQPNCIQQLVSQSSSQSHNDTMNHSDGDTASSAPAPDTTTTATTPVPPLEIVYGHIGRLEVHIPWKVIRNSFFQLAGTSSSSNNNNNKTSSTSSVKTSPDGTINDDTNNKANKKTTNDSNSKKSKSNDNISILLCDVNILIAPQKRHTNPSRSNNSTNHDTKEEEKQQTRSYQGGEDDNDDDENDMESEAVDSEGDDEDNKSPDIQRQQQQQHTEVNNDDVRIEPSIQTRKPMTWKQKLQEQIKSIFSNLSVTIQNIHVRYEDNGYGFVGMMDDHPSTMNIINTNNNKDMNDSFLVSDLNNKNDNDYIQSLLPKSPEQHMYGNWIVLSSSSPPTSPYNSMVQPSQQQLQQYDRRRRYRSSSFTIGITLQEFTIQQQQQQHQQSKQLQILQQSKHIIAATQNLAIYWDSHINHTDSFLLLYEQQQQEQSRMKNTVDDSNSKEQPYMMGPDRFNFFREAFDRINNYSTSTSTSSTTRTMNYQHMYLLDPFSPSIEFGLAPPVLPSSDDTNSNHSTMNVIFPPCRWNISKHLLDDVRYMKKSWQMFVELAGPVHSTITNKFETKQYDLNTPILETKNSNDSNTDIHIVEQSEETKSKSLTWKINWECDEFSLQLHDSMERNEKTIVRNNVRRTVRSVPVVRLSCAFRQDLDIFEYGSWNLVTQIGSLFVKDCTVDPTNISNSNNSTHFPILVGLKNEIEKAIQPVNTFQIQNNIHHQVVWVEIKRSRFKVRDETIQSLTETTVRILPLEIVYLTAPIESISHIFSTMNEDFSDDLNRIKNRFDKWKDRQQKRLISALAHKRKRMNIDVVIGAPILLIPDGSHTNASLMIFDLGSLQFTSETVNGLSSKYDDRWLLEMKDMQVKRMLALQYYNSHPGEGSEVRPRFIVEPFSLKFDIQTMVTSETLDPTDRKSAILVSANLPRLALNITTIDFRHVHRLQSLWEKRKKDRIPVELRVNVPAHTIRNERSNVSLTESAQTNREIRRELEFHFLAPILSICLEAENEHSNELHGSIPILDVALRGIEGNLMQKSSAQCTNTLFSSKIRGLVVVDLYQSGGIDYSVLLSSVSPEIVMGVESIHTFTDTFLSVDHLVTFNYNSTTIHRNDYTDPQQAVLNIDESRSFIVKFHELFVEWNPETIAVLSAALKSQQRAAVVEERGSEADIFSEGRASVGHLDEEFFDAEEEAFYDAESVASGDQRNRLLSEISESEKSGASDLMEPASNSIGQKPTWSGIKGPLPVFSHPIVSGTQWTVSSVVPPPHKGNVGTSKSRPWSMIFELSKLRVGFNKETRRRRLIIAEMDRTQIQYNTMESGVTKIIFNIGNLTFSDCESVHNNTLYREILGLKTEGSGISGEQSSLLEMEMITKPRSRAFVDLEDKINDPSSSIHSPVLVDKSKGIIHGFDNYLEARLSPMRFVYLQQLWFEIIDYFFIGIVGYEVWGNETPVPGDTTMLEGKSIGADEIPFTRFDVVLDSPVILFPVSAFSTDFIRMTASSITLRNWYNLDSLRPPSLFFRIDGESRQWYNNCDVVVDAMQVSSWSGSILNHEELKPNAKVALAWPVGPSAPVNVPKWNVNCDFDEMNLVLDREDYALLQHVIQFNIGSASLHLEEWDAFQKLDKASRNAYNEKVIVHFPYDKKDATPSTFDMKVTVPKICFVLTHGKGRDVAVVRCSNLQWRYNKFTDRISRQSVLCFVDIFDSILGRTLLSSEETLDSNFAIALPRLEYKSCLYPSFEMQKSLVIADSCIEMIYPSWMSFTAFFQNLPAPTYLSPNEAIQVGDRWYKIGVQSSQNSLDSSMERLRWIQDLGHLPVFPDENTNSIPDAPKYAFHFSLLNPAIKVSSGFSTLVFSLLRFNFLHSTEKSLVSQTLTVDGATLQTRQSGVIVGRDNSAIIGPWNAEIVMSGCQDPRTCTCSCHSYVAKTDVLYARIAYSEIIVALDASMNLMRDVRSSKSIYLKETSNTALESTVSGESQRDANVKVKRNILIFVDGVSLVLTDDSGRHFLGSQDLAIVTMTSIKFTWNDGFSHDFESQHTVASHISSRMHLQFMSILVIDCLQNETSPFRTVLSLVPPTSRVDDNNSTGSDERENQSDLLSEDLPTFEMWSEKKESLEYGFEFNDIDLQYNPSFVVALQRYLGRLLKDTRQKHGDLLQVFTKSNNDRIEDSPKHIRAIVSTFRLIIRVRSLSISLNKEHQERRLLTMSIFRIFLEYDLRRTHSCFSGRIFDFSSIDPSMQGKGIAELFMKSTPGLAQFVEFTYIVSKSPDFELGEVYTNCPSWIQSKIVEDDGIDDVLDISIGTLEMVYLKERTAELLDYLSNGMPGRGMGATSRAAKGFVRERIHGRSFANIQLGAPKLLIPWEGCANIFISIMLGNFSMMSWIVVDATSSMKRMVKIQLYGFTVNLSTGAIDLADENQLMDDLDFEVDMELSESCTSINCQISDVACRLTYTEYMALLWIIRDTLGKRYDKTKWDNLEKAWATEYYGKENGPSLYPMEISYSSSARVIRYGQSKDKNMKQTFVNITFLCGSLGLVLRRDDNLHVPGSSYDMIGVRVHCFECEMGRRIDGELWLNISVQDIFAVDLGKNGRLLRSNATENDQQIVDSLSVLMEGYSAAHSQDGTKSDIDSQLIVKVESTNAGDINVVVIISFMSLTGFVKPLQDLISFITCKWKVPSMKIVNAARRFSTLEMFDKDEAKSEGGAKEYSIDSKFSLRFVSHYSRFIFAADELDAHSRSLVLRGLSIANASLLPTVGDSCHEMSLSLNMDFQEVSSHIHADIAELIRIRQHHLIFLSGILSEDCVEDMSLLVVDTPQEALGTPLLLPLSVSLEFEQHTTVKEPSRRSLAISIDPLSIMFSNEDLKILQAIIDGLSVKSESSVSTVSCQKFYYETTFTTERLGLGLRKEAGQIVVDNVAELRNDESIQIGDFLFAINGVEISDLETISLNEMVSRLSSSRRPLVITFGREIRQQVEKNQEESHRINVFTTVNTADKINISMSSASFTVVEREVPLMRAAVSMSKIACNIIRSKGTAIRLEVSTGISIDYYNLRIWDWEPFLDPGVICLSSTYQDAYFGPRELSVELGDKGFGVSINLTDSFISTVSKLLEWRLEGQKIDTTTVNPKIPPQRDTISANAAFRFAARQKIGTTKYYEIRNRTGVSIAFVRQRFVQAHAKSKLTFNYLGEYNGLQHYDSSEIQVLANEEDCKFRVDINSDSDSYNGHVGRFPFFVVALQKTFGVAVKPFENLETASQGEVLLPLLFETNDLKRPSANLSVRSWATWLVEQLDEKTVVTIGTSVRVLSMLSRTVEIGIAAAGSPDQTEVNVTHLGTLREGICFNLPLWIALQQHSYICYIRIAPEFSFAPMFSVAPDGSVNLYNTENGFVECRHIAASTSSSWLAISVHDEQGLLTIKIDCAVKIRNLLPISIEWEVGQNPDDDDVLIDGSRMRSRALQSGEEVEILTGKFSKAKLRLCPSKGYFTWSQWINLSTSCTPRSDHVIPSDQSHDVGEVVVHEDTYKTVYVNDVFHVSLPLGVRISSHVEGVDVTVYTDIWCSNCTSLDLLFGMSNFNEQSTEAIPSKELTVGEATLKEISSIFESGDFVRRFDSHSRVNKNDIIRIPGQACSYITEECFEYVEVEGNAVRSRWWASENPFSTREYLMGSDQEQCRWIDKNWRVDSFDRTAEGWESSSDLDPFLGNRIFNPSHRYRRRRWTRRREGLPSHTMVHNVNTFLQLPRDFGSSTRDGKTDQSTIQLGIQVNGGRWSRITTIPRQGSFHGVVRISKSRWLYAESEASLADKTVYELCYVVSPLDGDWGLLTRSLLVTSRFLLHNDSKNTTFEVKQAGAVDSSCITIHPGQRLPFHWGSYHLHELICVRPLVRYLNRSVYKWSGGFDPLVIGHIPLRIRRTFNENAMDVSNEEFHEPVISALKVEIEIRPRTGGTGINLAFKEEDGRGEGALFRIENNSPFSVWFCQDDILVNPSHNTATSGDSYDVVGPSSSSVFALDIPFKQGKYSHRKAAALATLLRVRLALAPFQTRPGIETTKVVSMTIGETVRLNPSKLIITDPALKHSLQNVRIIGHIVNDGPTRVLQLSIVSQTSSNNKPWMNIESAIWLEDLPFSWSGTGQGEGDTKDVQQLGLLPSQDEINRSLYNLHVNSGEEASIRATEGSMEEATTRNLIVSFRAAISGLMISFVDAAPSEIAVATFKNINALATWDTLRLTDSTIYVTVTSLQVDNMVPNSPFPVAVCPFDQSQNGSSDETTPADSESPLLVVGLSFAPKHKSGVLCLKSATIAPRNLAIKVDLAFLVRLQKFALDMKEHFNTEVRDWGDRLTPPDIDRLVTMLNTSSPLGNERKKIYFGGLTILPCNIKLSVAPARALTPAQATLEGAEIAAIHQAVRKGDVRVDKKSAGILGVKIGSRNKTPLAVVRGLFKSFIVDGLLRLDGASLNFSGVSLRNHTSTTSQLTTALTAHYLASLRQNLPAVLGSLAAFGNPLGLVRGLGEGVGDFVLEPVRGFQRSVQEMDASYLVDGVARGTLSLTRHTVGGFADSAAMIAETFSKNMAVLTLDRKYAQKRDRGDMFRDYDDINVASGIGSGVQKLVGGFVEGVTGVVRAPIRGAEKHGFEGFAKGIGKGLLGLLVKPIIGISDGFSDVMIGVKGSVDGGHSSMNQPTQVRPRRALYGREKAIRSFHFPDAAASALMLRTRLAGEPYLSHLDLGDRVILVGCKRFVMLGRHGEELLLLRLRNIESVEVRGVTSHHHNDNESSSVEWGVVILLDTPKADGSDVEVIACKEKAQAEQLCRQLKYGRDVACNS